MTWDEILNIGGSQVPYFRTSEFSELMLDNEKMMIDYICAPKGSRCVFLTGSGTMGMEAAVINTLTTEDKALVVNGGSFGHRFEELCALHHIPHDVIRLKTGENLTSDDLTQYEGGGYTSLLVNIHETSTGVLYDMNMISGFCKRNGMFLIVDAISAFLADSIDMNKNDIDVIITSSQKAFACAPGITMLTLSPRALDRIARIDSGNMYMDVSSALDNANRGQTPFTPAVLTLLQINRRLHMVKERGGVLGECEKVAAIATYFRKEIEGLPLETVSKSMSNAVTSLHPTNGMSAKRICDILKDEYNIWICPNGGDMADYMFRVGHIGNITLTDVDTLVYALKEVLQ